MKAIVTFIFILLISTSAMAQDAKNISTVKTFTAGIELNIAIEDNSFQAQEVARLYMFKNSRVKKALKFRTKRNNAKMA
ncbi:MAG: hypothetical protein ACFB0A_10115 [Croceivirga sp.]